MVGPSEFRDHLVPGLKGTIYKCELPTKVVEKAKLQQVLEKNYQLNCNKTEYRWKSLKMSSVGIMILKIKRKWLKEMHDFVRCCKIILGGAQLISTELMQGDKLSTDLLQICLFHFSHLQYPILIFIYLLEFCSLWFGVLFVREKNFLFTFCMRNHLQPIALSENLDLKTLQIIFFSCITLGVISNKFCHFPPQQSFGCPSLCKTLPVTVGQAFLSSSLPKLHFPLQRNAAWN